MYLPVNCAFAGMGQYAAVASFGSMSGKASRLSRTTRFATRGGHHPIAKFLGGNPLQHLIKLPKHIHDAFHAALTTKLRELGFPRRLFGGPSGSTKKWLK